MLANQLASSPEPVKIVWLPVTSDAGAGSSMPPQRPPAVSGAKTTGWVALPSIWSVPLTTISAALPPVPLPPYTVTIVPSPITSVAPAATVRVPVTRIREWAGQTVLEASEPETSVNAGAASMVTEGFSESPASRACSCRVPGAAGGSSAEPQPRRSGRSVAGEPPKLTWPLSRSGSFAGVRSTVATGTGSPAGQDEGAITSNTAPAKADGASFTLR